MIGSNVLTKGVGSATVNHSMAKSIKRIICRVYIDNKLISHIREFSFSIQDSEEREKEVEIEISKNVYNGNTPLYLLFPIEEIKVQYVKIKNKKESIEEEFVFTDLHIKNYTRSCLSDTHSPDLEEFIVLISKKDFAYNRNL